MPTLAPASWRLAGATITLLSTLLMGQAEGTSSPPPPYSPLTQERINATLSNITIINGFLIFFMQVGFVSLELGFVRSKNVRNILLKNMVDVLLCALCWWAVGYALANGASRVGFMGGTLPTSTGPFFGESDNDWSSKSWFFSFTFALATVSIVSGCLAERTNLIAYPILTVVLSMWVHPLIAFWAWKQESWLQNMAECEFLDFAGGTVVHVVGGCMGLIGAMFCGPRLGRFEDGKAKPMPGHDVSSVAIGTIFLWFGMFGFNCGSVYTQVNAAHLLITGFILDRVVLNMTLGAAGAGLTALLISSFRSRSLDLVICCNGILSGLVSATPGCAYIVPWAALVVGMFSGGAYLGCSRLMLYFQIDDPLDSTAVHVCSGVVGTLLNGAFAKPEYVSELVGSSCGGFIYSSTGGVQLGMQMLGVLVSMAWTIVFAVAVFWPLHWLGRLRVDQATELAGIDNMEHGGPAYPEFSLTVLNNPSC